MTAVPVLLVNQHLTAVAATSTGDYTVVFLGTANGRLKKVYIVCSIELAFMSEVFSFSGELFVYFIYWGLVQNFQPSSVQECSLNYHVMNRLWGKTFLLGT